MLQPIIIVINDPKELDSVLESATRIPLVSESELREPGCPYCTHHQEKVTENPKVKRKKRKKAKRKSSEVSFHQLDEDDTLYRITDACDRLGICRSTLKSLRDEGHITDIKKAKKSVRFSAKQVEKVRLWYSIPKGKV